MWIFILKEEMYLLSCVTLKSFSLIFGTHLKLMISCELFSME